MAPWHRKVTLYSNLQAVSVQGPWFDEGFVSELLISNLLYVVPYLSKHPSPKD